MDRFKNILFVYSGQEADAIALERAIKIAEKNQSRLTLLAVYEPVPDSGKLFFGTKKVEQLNAALQEQLTNAVDSLAQLVPSGVYEKRIIKSNSPFEIVLQVLSHKHDLVVKLREGYGEPKNIASADMRLLRKCPCPVWIINSKKKEQISRILAAIDPDPTDGNRLKLHLDVLKLATTLALREEAQLDVLHAWELLGENTLRGPRFRMDEAEIATLAMKEKAIHEKWMEDILHPFRTKEIKMRSYLVQGPSSQVILDFIQKRHYDPLIMGTLARSGIPGLIIGNTAETVLTKARCSTLTIKPADFKSPVG